MILSYLHMRTQIIHQLVNKNVPSTEQIIPTGKFVIHIRTQKQPKNKAQAQPNEANHGNLVIVNLSI